MKIVISDQLKQQFKSQPMLIEEIIQKLSVIDINNAATSITYGCQEFDTIVEIKL